VRAEREREREPRGEVVVLYSAPKGVKAVKLGFSASNAQADTAGE
jgi:hypothetical protein